MALNRQHFYLPGTAKTVCVCVGGGGGGYREGDCGGRGCAAYFDLAFFFFSFQMPDPH